MMLGTTKAPRITRIASTSSTSISVKAPRRREEVFMVLLLTTNAKLGGKFYGRRDDRKESSNEQKRRNKASSVTQARLRRDLSIMDFVTAPMLSRGARFQCASRN